MSDIKPIALILIIIGILGSIGTAVSLLQLIEYGTPEIDDDQPPSALETGNKIKNVLLISITIIFGCIIFTVFVGLISKLR